MQCFWNPRKVIRSYAFYYLLNIHVLLGILAITCIHLRTDLIFVYWHKWHRFDLDSVLSDLCTKKKEDKLLHETFSFMNMNEHEYKA